MLFGIFACVSVYISVSEGVSIGFDNECSYHADIYNAGVELALSGSSSLSNVAFETVIRQRPCAWLHLTSARIQCSLFQKKREELSNVECDSSRSCLLNFTARMWPGISLTGGQPARRKQPTLSAASLYTNRRSQLLLQFRTHQSCRPSPSRAITAIMTA